METIRPHYSWSQHSLFKSSKLSFYKAYVLGEEKKSNIRFEKGKEFGKYKETGEIPHWVDDPLLEEVAEAIPDLDYKEQEITVDFFKGREDQKPDYYKPLLMYTDASKKDLTEFHEYKTGKTPWTQQKVNEHGQLDFYATGLYILSGQKVIPKCKLYWIETEDIEMTDGTIKVVYTGHVEEFEREFTEEEILATMIDILNTQREISEWDYNELELPEEKANRYIELLDKKAEIDAELNLIKLDVETQLLENGLEYAVAEAGKFSFTSRRSYSFSEELEELKDKYKTEIKKKEDLEKKTGVAKEYVNKSIRFTRNKK